MIFLWLGRHQQLFHIHNSCSFGNGIWHLVLGVWGNSHVISVYKFVNRQSRMSRIFREEKYLQIVISQDVFAMSLCWCCKTGGNLLSHGLLIAFLLHICSYLSYYRFRSWLASLAILIGFLSFFSVPPSKFQVLLYNLCYWKHL